MTRIHSVVAVPVTYSFARHFGGADKVPPSIASPSSHFQRIKRLGQAATFVRVTDDAGNEGFGECFGLPSPGPSAILIEELIAPSLVGEELHRPADLLADWRRYFITLGNTQGAAMEALSGVDIALWDLLARRSGRSLTATLGGKASTVPTYASPVPLVADPAQSIGAARAFLDLGFRAVKLKIGRAEVADDAAHIRAVRDALPAGAALMLDANCAYTLDRARRLVDLVAGLDIAWLEEPLPPGAFAEMRELARHSPMPIAAGENLFTIEAFTQLAEEAEVKILQPNISRAGGVSGLLAIDRLAGRHGAALSPHGVGAATSIAALLQTCAALETFTLVEANRLLNPLRDGFHLSFMPDADGRLRLPQGPGHGGAPDPATFAELAGEAAAARLWAA
ncbi:MAG: mandelate racemase/muconate lactonizing enzyme family protein [Geminicoccaceae bacterium]